MTCKQMDDLRNEGGSSKAALSRSAREHLQSCQSCRQLQAFWDFPMPTVEVPQDVQARVTQRIVTDLKSVAPLPSDLVLNVGLLGLAMMAITAGAWWLGQAGWHALAPGQSATVFSLLSGSMLLMADVVSRHMLPGTRQRIALFAAMTGIFALLLIAILLLFPFQPDPNFVSTGLKCWERGLLTAAGAGVLFVPVLRRGAWLSPLKSGAATGCLAGLVGLTVLEIYCPYLERGHIGFWHWGAALTATILGIVIAAISHLVQHRKD